ncbi:hypothetical protein MK805_02315 [Shimazuella sp. AN120528]|uniref:hypothetical protein n=1 Tax=Shimazuella soli TaxID=1892854 RepID=UPI001F0E3A8D|nr:hypothetical protein [Shimazuella soli]MCH5583802.1 hypothetical protein [Shimazuella soli]
MTFFDPDNQIFEPSAIGGRLIMDREKGKLSYFHYEITLPTGVRVNAAIGRTIYLIGAGITGTITFTVHGGGIIKYWGSYNGEKVNHTFTFQKGKILKDVYIGWFIR